MSGEEGNYIFPRGIANILKGIDQRTQYEASMLSMIFMMLGLVLSVLYMVFYLNFATWFKIVTVINGFFGLIFMLSYLTTTFQQYKTYMEFKAFSQDDYSSQSNNQKGGRIK